jgi:hypothetical protein
MNQHERRRHLKTILNEHTGMLADFSANGEAYKSLIVAFQAVVVAFQSIVTAVNDAQVAQQHMIERLYTANTSALTLDAAEKAKPLGKRRGAV